MKGADLSDFSSLALGVPLAVRPLHWPSKRPRRAPSGVRIEGAPVQRHEQARFTAPWSSTVELLRAEIAHLAPERVILELDVPPGAIRLDGFPRADARASSPAVMLRIEREPTRWMNLPCDTYDDWRDNLRAIALTLDRLRDIDRWGVTQGEQYEGFLAIPARTMASTPGIHSPQEAAEFLARHAGQEGDSSFVQAILSSASVREIARKRAATKLHPDAGGTAADFQRLQAAVRMLELNADG